MEAGRVWGAGLLQMRCINTIGRRGATAFPSYLPKRNNLAQLKVGMIKTRIFKSVGDNFAKTNEQGKF